MLDDRKQLEARLAEAQLMLKQCGFASLLVALTAMSLTGGFAVALPIVLGVGGVATWRYRRAKRELAALDRPPTARLLR